MNVTIGRVDCDPRVLDKSTHMTSTRTISVQIDSNCSVKNPRFLLDLSAYDVHANYCSIPAWGAYYYLGEPSILDGGRCVVNGTLDPLTTYAAQIKTLTGYLLRTQDTDHVNKFVMDPQKPAQENRRCRTYDFNRSPFTANYAQDAVYILTVIGGHHA